MLSWNRIVAEALNSGMTCNLIHASVMMPRMPSEPRTSRSGLGPAPEYGTLRVSRAPLGVSNRIDSTNSSICVYPVAKCPADRVAIHPPREENSKLWGKWRRLKLYGF